MTKKRKQSYLLLAGAAMLALLIDRLVVTDVETSPATARASHAQPAVAEAAVPSMPELPFPENLEPYLQGDPVRDIFAMPVDNRSPILPEKTQQAIDRDQGGANAILTAAKFRVAHHLDGLLDTDGLRLAIVDGRWLRVGQRISGCTLERVIGTSVFFRCPDGEVELKIGVAELKKNGLRHRQAQ